MSKTERPKDLDEEIEKQRDLCGEVIDQLDHLVGQREEWYENRVKQLEAEKAELRKKLNTLEKENRHLASRAGVSADFRYSDAP